MSLRFWEQYDPEEQERITFQKTVSHLIPLFFEKFFEWIKEVKTVLEEKGKSKKETHAEVAGRFYSDSGLRYHIRLFLTEFFEELIDPDLALYGNKRLGERETGLYRDKKKVKGEWELIHALFRAAQARLRKRKKENGEEQMLLDI